MIKTTFQFCLEKSGGVMQQQPKEQASQRVQEATDVTPPIAKPKPLVLPTQRISLMPSQPSAKQQPVVVVPKQIPVIGQMVSADDLAV